LFSGTDYNGLTSVWVSDGTASGTKPVSLSANATSNGGLKPTDLTVFGNEVLFNGTDSAGDQGLWVTNGVAAGTHELVATAGRCARSG
jgi:hypothetical protein